MIKKKERKVTVSIELPPIITGKGGKIGFDKQTGEIHILDIDANRVSPDGLIMEHYYEGDTRRVLLSRLVSGSKFPLKGLGDLDFLATYDLVYIVDTNHLETPDRKSHDITSFLRATITSLSDAHRVELYERVGYFHFTNLVDTTHPEKAGWLTLIQQDFFKEDLHNGLTIAIITDHDIENLDAYNRREISILNSYYIPEGVTFMFAKADKRDTLVNKLIRTSDMLANIYKERFLKGEIILISQENSYIECEDFCFVNEKRKGLSIQPNIIKKSDLVFNEDSKISYSFFEESNS